MTDTTLSAEPKRATHVLKGLEADTSSRSSRFSGFCARSTLRGRNGSRAVSGAECRPRPNSILPLMSIVENLWTK